MCRGGYEAASQWKPKTSTKFLSEAGNDINSILAGD